MRPGCYHPGSGLSVFQSNRVGELCAVKTITVQVREDHLETLARTKPMTALSELVWNALDADATEVRVEFIENELEGLETIRIVDNGHGLSYADAVVAFQNLGGSWKRDEYRSNQRKRVLHGQYGKGRFRAFSMGSLVSWQSTYEELGQLQQFRISGKAESLGEFDLSDPRPAQRNRSGMIVEIQNVSSNTGLLRGGKAVEEVTEIFALYLRHYPDVRIIYDGVPIDPAHVEQQFADYVLDELVMQNGERVNAALTVVEWTLPGRRGVYLCDEAGFMRHNALPRLHFRGFSYTAYVKSAHIQTLDAEGLLQAGELAPDVRMLLDAARRKLREHFTLREAELAQDTIEEWKEQGLYPFEEAPKSDADLNERRIFDIYATHLNQIFPDFTTARPRYKRLTLRLIQELVKTEPTRMARILDDLLEFPEEKEGEVLELIQA